ncbi:MAG: Hcp family type VI secretion system effector [Planctomycetota bacterium]
MAMDMFFKIAGIKGESKDKSHKDEVEVMSWSWGMSQQGSFHQGSGGGAGKVNVNDLSFTHYIDKASPGLMLRCCNGEHIDTAKLTIRKAGKTQLEYLIINLTKVLVTSVSSGGSTGEDRLAEQVSLNFAQVSVDYSAQKDDGSGEAAINFKWDMEQNVND